jgi:hypothetical protein
MKTKALLSILGILFSFKLLAGLVPSDKAEQIALNFYYQKYNQYEGRIAYEELSIQSVYTEVENGDPVYHIFHINRGGFVLVAADDRLKPVLGYSFKNSFNAENQPQNVQYWFGQYKDQVIYVRNNKIEPDKKILGEWEYYLNNYFTKANTNTKSKAVDPLLSSRWNQDFPYNLYCPFDSASGSYTNTGCYGTAMAQIAYYWRWPDHGQGYTAYVPASHPEYGLQTADYENTWYRYNEMVDDPETANYAVAEYVYHFSVALHTDFSTGTSFVDSIFILNHQMACDSIAYHFKFDSLQFHYRDSMPDSDWKNLLMGMLDSKCPIFYAGYKIYPTIGHFFVCDGYQDEDYYHFNFGWGGISDGYYHMDSVLYYNSNHFCMSSIHPDTVQFNYPLYAAGADTLTYLEGSISDGSGPIHNYQDNTYASWLIDPQTMYDSVTSITIMVKKLDIFNDGDKLSIYDGEDNTAPLIAEITGSEIPEDMVSSSNKVFIEFISNGTNTASGFYLNYNCDQPVWCMGYTEITEPQGTINDGSGNFYYNNGSSCIWVIDPGLNQPLYLDFNYFNTENNSDVFSVYDGETQELLGEFSGDYQSPNLPPIVVSNSGKFFITFQTNASVRNDGWEINYGIYTGLNEYQHEFAFKLMPNPANDKTTIDFVFETDQEAFLTVINTNAQILKRIYLGKKDSGTYELNCSTFLPGVYFITIRTTKGILTEKLIIR